mgnify:CR=1 FL=1
MRIGTVVSVGAILALLACSKPEAPAPVPTGAPRASAPITKPSPIAAATQAPAMRQPKSPMPTIVMQRPAAVPEDQRHKETPCDRNEAGWKWVGNVVEDGRCAVGPCDCVKS